MVFRVAVGRDITPATQACRWCLPLFRIGGHLSAFLDDPLDSEKGTGLPKDTQMLRGETTAGIGLLTQNSTLHPISPWTWVSPRATHFQPTSSSTDSSFNICRRLTLSLRGVRRGCGFRRAGSKARKIWVQIQVPSCLSSGTLSKSLTSLSPRMWYLQMRLITGPVSEGGPEAELCPAHRSSSVRPTRGL